MEKNKFEIVGFMGGKFIFNSKEELRCWVSGALHSLYAFSHWKDGKMYVGTVNSEYTEVANSLMEVYKESTGEEFEEFYE